MIGSRRLRWAGAVTAGAVALGMAVAGTTATSADAAARPALHAGSGHMTPAIGAQPPHRKAGTVTPGVQPNYPLLFGCQKPTADFICYGPDQMRTAYGFDTLINAGYTGKGRTIVIVDAYSDPALRRDLSIFDEVVRAAGCEPSDQWRRTARLRSTRTTRTRWVGPARSLWTWSTRTRWLRARRSSSSWRRPTQDSDLQSALQYVADNNLGDVLSQSFGEAESCLGVNEDGTHQPGVTIASAHRQYRQMADEGMTAFASAGDDGSAQPTCDGSGEKLAASTPASDPLVTGVGGTQLFANPRSGAYDHEVVWNEDREFGAAGGGGFSSYFDQPGVPARSR